MTCTRQRRRHRPRHRVEGDGDPQLPDDLLELLGLASRGDDDVLGAERAKLEKAASKALKLGGTKADLKYDIQRGWVTVLAPPPAPAAPAAEAGGSPGSSASSDSAPRSTDPVAYLPETPVWPSPAKEPLPNAAVAPPAVRD